MPLSASLPSAPSGAEGRGVLGGSPCPPPVVAGRGSGGRGEQGGRVRRNRRGGTGRAAGGTGGSCWRSGARSKGPVGPAGRAEASRLGGAGRAACRRGGLPGRSRRAGWSGGPVGGVPSSPKCSCLISRVKKSALQQNTSITLLAAGGTYLPRPLNSGRGKPGSSRSGTHVSWEWKVEGYEDLRPRPAQSNTMELEVYWEGCRGTHLPQAPE